MNAYDRALEVAKTKLQFIQELVHYGLLQNNGKELKIILIKLSRQMQAMHQHTKQEVDSTSYTKNTIRLHWITRNI